MDQANWTPPPKEEGWQETPEGSGLWVIKDAANKIVQTKWSPAKTAAMKAARDKAKERPVAAEKLGQLFVDATRPSATEEQRQLAKDALIKSLASEVVKGGPRAVAAIQSLGATLGELFKQREVQPTPIVRISAFPWLEVLARNTKYEGLRFTLAEVCELIRSDVKAQGESPQKVLYPGERPAM